MASSVLFRIVRGTTFERSFQRKNADGSTVSSIGQTMVFYLCPAQTDTPVLTLDTSGTPSADGSTLVWTNQSLSQFKLNLTNTETTAFLFSTGTWWMNRIDGADVWRNGDGLISVQKL